MNGSQPPEKPARRPKRGRPAAAGGGLRRRDAGPTAARLMAVRIVERVHRVRAFADLALHHALARSALSGRDRALATELVYGTLRWRGRIDFLLGHVLDRELEKLEPLVASTLRVGAYQVLFADRIPATAAVDQAVHCARALGAERATGLVNAVMRRLAREHASIALPSPESDPLGHLAHTLSLPTWIAERWLALYGPEEAAALAEASNAPPPLTIRANRQRIARDALLAELRPRFPEASPCRLAPDGIVLGHHGHPALHPAFREGLYSVQDEGSQLVVELLDPRPGESVLDACAAPGTKTSAIAERIGEAGEVLALDRHPGRLGLVGRAARRLRLPHVRTLARDASRPLTDLAPRREPGAGGQAGFDRVLVDAPCTGLGSLRRNPDARWRVQPGDPDALAEVQLAILDRSAAAVRPGGTLVYSTCTLVPEENEGAVERFLDAHRAFRLLPRADLPASLAPVLSEEGWMRCHPHRHDTDGFFAARLERTA